MPIDISRARKKLRQAEFFLAHLRRAPEDMALQLRSASEPNPEPLEFWFSACLSAAQSVYYVLEQTGGGDFKRIQTSWRSALDTSVGYEFGWTIGVRGDDVHLASIPGSALSKMVPAPASEQQWQWGNDALNGPFLSPQHKNPDGTVVACNLLVGSLGLYIDTPAGERVDAEILCQRFVDHLRTLLIRIEHELS